jgi:hypothetical protein
MKKTLLATLAIIVGSSAFAASPAAVGIQDIKCLEGKVNSVMTKELVGVVGGLTTEGFLKTLVMGEDGLVQSNYGVVENDKAITLMIPASGQDDSFCVTARVDATGNRVPTYLVIKAQK